MTWRSGRRRAKSLAARTRSSTTRPVDRLRLAHHSTAASAAFVASACAPATGADATSAARRKAAIASRRAVGSSNSTTPSPSHGPGHRSDAHQCGSGIAWHHRNRHRPADGQVP